MIKQFRLNKNKSSNNKSGDRFDFNFFNIQALQVPKGWDKLSVSIISAETGKPTSKTGKASVRHGNCRWTETLSESVWISIDEASLELEQCLFKLLISMGSSKSGILGEATVNVAGYATSKASAVVSLPLKKCNYGTILQVEIQCLTPNTILRNERRRDTNSYTEDANAYYDDVDSRSDISDSSFNKSVGSSSSNRLYGTSRAGELGSRETSFWISGSRPSVDSMDSLGRESFSSQSGTASNLVRRQDSSDSQNSASHGSPQLDRRHQREDFGQIPHASPLRNKAGSSEEVNIEEIRAEARMWERNARKLQEERDGLKQEIEQLQVLLEESTVKQKVYGGNSKFKGNDKDDDIHKELEKENDNLAQQLKKAQESNLELVSCLQEMEETIENQKTEIDSLLKSKSDDTGLNRGTVEHELQELQEKMEEKNKELQIKEEEIAKLEAKLLPAQDSKLSELENRGDLDQNEEIKALREKIQELENDCAELTDENLELLMKLKASNKDPSTDGASRNSSFKEGPTDFESKLSELKKRELVDANLQIRCNDLESKCEELELQLQEFKTLSEEQEAEIVALLQLLENQKAENSGTPTEEKVTIDLADENETEGDNSKKNIRCSSCQRLESLNKELQSRVEDMGKEIFEGHAEIEELKADLLAKEEEIEVLRSRQMDLENQVSDLEKIEETIEVIQREGEVIMEKNLELESFKNELEQNLSELNEEKLRLSQQVSDLKAQLRSLTDSKESSHLDLKSNAINLRDETRRLQNEMEAQREDMRNKFEEMQKRWLEAQQECERLKNVNPKLKNTADSLVEDCNSLQKSNRELRDQLEKIPMLQDEVLVLTNSLDEVKFENERLKASLELVSVYNEESKANKNSISSMQNVGPEVLHDNDAELKKELGRIKKKNSGLHRKMKCLEEEKVEWKNKVQNLEEELKQKKGVKEELNGTICGEVKLSEEADYASKIQILENELAEAMEANDMYKAQIKSLLAEGQIGNSAPPKNDKFQRNTINEGGENEDKSLSALEAELNDIRERYLHMSLKYAEVEEQREQLVLKLKTVSEGSRWKWFSS